MVMYLTVPKKKGIPNKLFFFHVNCFFALDFPQEIGESSEIAVYDTAQWYHILYNFHPPQS